MPEFSVPSTAIGFKEWSFVCNSLTQGVQSLILRKGGIHEGRGGFEWKHRSFFLFPTWFHNQAEKLNWVPGGGESQVAPEDERQTVEIEGFANLEKVWKLTDLDKVLSLAPLHVWREEVVRERFVYDDESCLHVALIRAYRLPEKWVFPYSKSYGGCRSWVNLPEDGLSHLPRATPALSDADYGALRDRLTAILGA